MPNLIDKLITKVDAVRQKAADKFGLPAHNLYRVFRTWSGGDVGNGLITDVVTLITPTPKIEFTPTKFRLDPDGLVDQRRMKATEISLSYTENFLQGEPRVAGQECIYKLEERNGQGADTTWWVLDNVPLVVRDQIYWELSFSTYVVC